MCTIPLAMAIHEKLTHAIVAYLPEKALSRFEQRARPHKDTSFTWDETYTLPENLFLAYQRSGKPFYRDMAKQYLEDDTYFDPLAEGNNVLPFEHAYSHVNAFSSAMQAYITLGSEKHLRAARNGFEMLQKTQSFATGGWGPNEAFGEPGTGQLGDSLGTTHASFETPCGAYGHFKITRYLLRVTKDAHYGDSMERVLVQHHPGRMADPGRRNVLLLLRLRQHRKESLVRAEMAVLFGHVSAACRRLSCQHLPARDGRRLCEPVRAFQCSVDPGKREAGTEAGYELSVREQDRDPGLRLATQRVHVICAHPGLGKA